MFFSFPLPVLVGTAADWHKETEREGGRRRKVGKSLISRTKGGFFNSIKFTDMNDSITGPGRVGEGYWGCWAWGKWDGRKHTRGFTALLLM